MKDIKQLQTDIENLLHEEYLALSAKLQDMEANLENNLPGLDKQAIQAAKIQINNASYNLALSHLEIRRRILNLLKDFNKSEE
jgi:hypothetical protein